MQKWWQGKIEFRTGYIRIRGAELGKFRVYSQLLSQKLLRNRLHFYFVAVLFCYAVYMSSFCFQKITPIYKQFEQLYTRFLWVIWDLISSGLFFFFDFCFSERWPKRMSVWKFVLSKENVASCIVSIHVETKKGAHESHLYILAILSIHLIVYCHNSCFLD